MTTQAQAIEMVRSRIDEEHEGFVADREIRMWLNEGVREIARRAEWKRTSTSIAGVAGTQFYTLPTNAIRVYRAEYTSSGQTIPLEYRDIQTMDAVWGAHQTISQGWPGYYTLVSANPLSLQLYPKPSTSGTLKVYYYAMPTDLATNTSAAASTALDVPLGWEDAVIEWATALAFRKMRDVGSYQIARDHFNQTVAELVEMSVRYTDEATVITPDGGYWYEDY